jgi:hypothetical protein
LDVDVMKIIFSDALAQHLGMSEEGVLELARLGKLPFAISTSSPRRLFISATDLPSWKQAARCPDCE